MYGCAFSKDLSVQTSETTEFAYKNKDAPKSRVSYETVNKYVRSAISQQHTAGLYVYFVARNAVVVCLAGSVYAICLFHGLSPFSASNQIPSGLPPFKFPDFSLDLPADNRTITTHEIFQVSHRHYHHSLINKTFIIALLFGLVLQCLGVGWGSIFFCNLQLKVTLQIVRLGLLLTEKFSKFQHLPQTPLYTVYTFLKKIHTAKRLDRFSPIFFFLIR